MCDIVVVVVVFCMWFIMFMTLFCVFLGEGCCVNTLQGPGKVILQSMSFAKFKSAVAPPPQKQEGPPDAAGANAGAGGN